MTHQTDEAIPKKYINKNTTTHGTGAGPVR
jgi:hypothetical protein